MEIEQRVFIVRNKALIYYKLQTIEGSIIYFLGNDKETFLLSLINFAFENSV